MNENHIPTIEHPKFDQDFFMIWNDECENVYGDRIGQYVAVSAAYQSGYIPAILVMYVCLAKHRTWEARAIIIGSENDSFPARISIDLKGQGEKAELPGGGRKMHPRVPVEGRVTAIVNSKEEIQKTIDGNVYQFDMMAEEKHQEAVRGSLHHQDIMRKDLFQDKPWWKFW